VLNVLSAMEGEFTETVDKMDGTFSLLGDSQAHSPLILAWVANRSKAVRELSPMKRNVSHRFLTMGWLMIVRA